MHREKCAAVAFALLPALTSCAGSVPARPPETPTEPVVMADTFFSGCAYLDENANGTIDPEDPLLGGITFTVTLRSGAGFGGDTADGVCAFITVPAALPPDVWPALARMTMPEGLAYEAIGPSEVLLEYPQTRADFLFTAD